MYSSKYLINMTNYKKMDSNYITPFQNNRSPRFFRNKKTINISNKVEI